MTARVTSLLIWAAVLASAAFWGLRLFTRATPVPAGAVVASAATAPGASLARLLGTPPVQPVAAAAPAAVDSRFRLLGVVAPRAGSHVGLALISVDGKPGRAFGVGRELEPGVRLLAVGHRQADLGPGGGAPAFTLALPPVAEASRGRPGQLAAPPAPGLPTFGQPGVMRPPAGVPPRQLPGVMPGVMPGQFNAQGAAPQPGEAELPDAPTESGGAPTR